MTALLQLAEWNISLEKGEIGKSRNFKTASAEWNMIALLIYNSITLLSQQNTWEGSWTLPWRVLYECGLKGSKTHWQTIE